MKSTVTNKAVSKPRPFPKLMIDPSDNQIILFYSEGAGTVVVDGECRDYKIGYYDEYWDMFGFIDFIGSICLEND
jgi:hypothetical protein